MTKHAPQILGLLLGLLGLLRLLGLLGLLLGLLGLLGLFIPKVFFTASAAPWAMLFTCSPVCNQTWRSVWHADRYQGKLIKERKRPLGSCNCMHACWRRWEAWSLISWAVLDASPALFWAAWDAFDAFSLAAWDASNALFCSSSFFTCIINILKLFTHKPNKINQNVRCIYTTFLLEQRAELNV